MRNLQAEAQAVILKQLTPEQIKQINIEAEAAIWEKLQHQKRQDILAQQQNPSQAQSVQSQIVAQSGGSQECMLREDQVAKVTMEKSDGSRKEFYIHQDHGAQVFSFCAQVDISGGSQNSGSVMLAPSAQQQLPQHTVSNIPAAEQQLFSHSHHSNTTASSVASAAPSFHSASSFTDPMPFPPSASTRYIF